MICSICKENIPRMQEINYVTVSVTNSLYLGEWLFNEAMCTKCLNILVHDHLAH
jgi:hypothetical protein